MEPRIIDGTRSVHQVPPAQACDHLDGAPAARQETEVEAQAHGTASATLRLQLDESYRLRGVALPQLLHGRGRRLTPSTPDAEQEAAQLWGLSREVQQITEFISHACKDAVDMKFLSLCLYFNGRPAALVSCLAACLVFLLNVAGALPRWIDAEWSSHSAIVVGYAPYCQISGALVFMVALVYWHHAPGWLGGGRGKAVFYDKFCIQQSDPMLKQAGIRSLSGIIANTQCFVVLWSSEYFSRLWCSLELATFCHLHERSSRDFGLNWAFRPLRLSTLTVAMILFTFTLSMLSNALFFTFKFAACFESVPTNSVLSLTIYSGFPFLLWTLRQYAHDRDNLRAQFAQFDVEATQCSCESDRTLIYDTINLWFGDIANFNEYVKTVVYSNVVGTIPHESRFPLKLSMFGTLAIFFNALDWTACFLDFDASERTFAASCIINVFFVPLLVFIIALDATSAVASTPCLTRKRSSAWCDYLVTLGTGLLLGIPFLLVLLVATNVVRYEGPVSMSLFSGFLAALSFLMRDGLPILGSLTRLRHPPDIDLKCEAT